MDKDSIILKYDQLALEDAEAEIKELHHSNQAQGEKLDDLKRQVYEMYAQLGITPKAVDIPEEEDEEEETDVPHLSYEEIYQMAHKDLTARGLDAENIDYRSLLPSEELAAIEKMLDRPETAREKWVKGDWIATFVAAAIGSLADIILGTRDNKLTGADPRKHFSSDFSSALNTLHKHAGGGPIDYQGAGFGGGFHRGLSKGHDILRFVEGISMFKNGSFEGIRYINGEAVKVMTNVNPFGNAYTQLPLIEAIAQYAKHMLADLCSTCSLPFPGSSFLVECSDRDLRKFAADMYQNGFNIKNILVQSLSTISIEVIIRVYFSIQSVQQYKKELTVKEDYSNLDAIKQFLKPVDTDKLNEMLLVAHTIVTAVNIGKVVLKKAPWELNVTEIISVVKYGIRVLKATLSRREKKSEFAKLMRNAEEIHKQWAVLEAEIVSEKELADTMKSMKPLVV